MDENTFPISDGYQKALTGLALFQQDKPGFLAISGVDRRDFLQCQTTNDINQLTPDRPLVTVLTPPSARILDVLTLIEEGEILRVITLPAKKMRR
jgi:folate-binding Fe-S cluster repair protein YgfZ